MPKVTQLVLNLESKPGTLARLCEVLGSAGVSIEAIWSSETATGKGRIRILAADIAKAESVLRAAKLRCSREEAIALSLENEAGALAAAVGKLAQAKVNIKCIYATTARMGRATAVLTVSNAQKASAILRG